MQKMIIRISLCILLISAFQIAHAECQEEKAGDLVKVHYKRNNLVETIVVGPSNIDGNYLESVILVIGEPEKPKYVASLSVFTDEGKAKLVLDGEVGYVNQSLLRFRYFTKNRHCYKVLLVPLQVKE